MRYLLCRHIKTNGVQCQSPSLADAQYCFFHARLHTRPAVFQTAQGPSPTDPTGAPAQPAPSHGLQLPALEDRESVQLALSAVINALASGQLETRRATALLYGLQLASFNSAHLQLSPYPPQVVRAVHFTPEGLPLAQAGTTGVTRQTIQGRTRRRRRTPGAETLPSC